jgi:hypothetical protein
MVRPQLVKEVKKEAGGKARRCRLAWSNPAANTRLLNGDNGHVGLPAQGLSHSFKAVAARGSEGATASGASARMALLPSVLRDSSVGLMLGTRQKLLADHLDLRRALETKPDKIVLDGEHLDGDAQAGEANFLILTSRKNEHGETPFQAVPIRSQQACLPPTALRDLV